MPQLRPFLLDVSLQKSPCLFRLCPTQHCHTPQLALASGCNDVSNQLSTSADNRSSTWHGECLCVRPGFTGAPLLPKCPTDACVAADSDRPLHLAPKGRQGVQPKVSLQARHYHLKGSAAACSRDGLSPAAMEAVLGQLQAVEVAGEPLAPSANRPAVHVLETGANGAVEILPTPERLRAVLPPISTVPAGAPPGYALRDEDVSRSPRLSAKHETWPRRRDR